MNTRKETDIMVDLTERDGQLRQIKIRKEKKKE